MLTSYTNNTAECINIPSSILNKLAAEELTFTSLHPHYSVADLLQEIQHDLMALLNYRRIPLSECAIHPELKDSLLSYGLPDLSYFNPHSETDRSTVRNLLQETISRFEKRLQNVYVSQGEVTNEQALTSMHFRISAELVIAPMLTPVVFDSLIYPIVDHVVINTVHH